jgi:hypothetical protein
MLILAFKLLYYESLLFFRRAKAHYLRVLLRVLPVVVQTRCARRMESLSTRLLQMQTKISRFEEHIRNGCFNELIDADRSIRDMLTGLKEDIRTIRCELAGLQEPGRKGYGAMRLGQALTQLHRIAEETYNAADRLLWEIDEHDHAYRAAMS